MPGLPGIGGDESILLHNNSDKNSNTLLHKALSVPSIHAHALIDFAI